MISPVAAFIYGVTRGMGREKEFPRRYEIPFWVEQFGIKGGAILRNILWIIGLGGLVWIGAHAEGMVVAPLTTAFSATGAHPSGYSVNDWASITESQPLVGAAQKLGKTLHMHASLVSRSTPEYRQISETQITSGVTTRVIVEQLRGGTTFAVLDRTSSHGFSGLSTTQRFFEEILRGQGSVHCNVNLVGTLPGRVSLTHAHQLMAQGLNAIGAVSLNSVKAGDYIATAAHTPFISTGDSLDGRPVNIQIAFTYNAYLHATQVYVGSPLLTVTY